VQVKSSSASGGSSPKSYICLNGVNSHEQRKPYALWMSLSQKRQLESR